MADGGERQTGSGGQQTAGGGGDRQVKGGDRYQATSIGDLTRLTHHDDDSDEVNIAMTFLSSCYKNRNCCVIFGSWPNQQVLSILNNFSR